ncbi:hypothetical protein Tco_1419449 [Tanacetum coccineum]
MVIQYGRSFHCLHSLIVLPKVLNYKISAWCSDMIQSTTCQQNVLRSLVVSRPLVVLANVVSSTGGSLEYIPSSNQAKIEYLYNSEIKIKSQAQSANVRRTYQLCAALLLKVKELKT